MVKIVPSISKKKKKKLSSIVRSYTFDLNSNSSTNHFRNCWKHKTHIKFNLEGISMQFLKNHKKETIQGVPLTLGMREGP